MEMFDANLARIMTWGDIADKHGLRRHPKMWAMLVLCAAATLVSFSLMTHGIASSNGMLVFFTVFLLSANIVASFVGFCYARYGLPKTRALMSISFFVLVVLSFAVPFAAALL